MKNKKTIIIIGILLVVLIAVLLFFKYFKTDSENNKLNLFSKENLIKDTYVIDDYENGVSIDI